MPTNFKNYNTSELLSLEKLLVAMQTDEYNAPGQYQKIINPLPSKFANMLRINQRQEREHYRRVTITLEAVRAELKKR